MLKILSRVECEKDMKDKEGKAVISIVGLKEESVDIGSTSKIELRFEDIERDIGGVRSIREKDIRGLKRYIDTNEGKELIVHCSAGVSRSAGVGLAILEYKGLEVESILENRRYIPNKKVYEVVCKELGIEGKYKERLKQNEEQRRQELDVELEELTTDTIDLFGLQIEVRRSNRTNK